MKTKKRQWWDLTTEQLAEATKEFDAEFVIDRAIPPSREQIAQLKRACRKRGRPRRGQGSKVISVSVEKSLLTRTDRLAKRLRTSRANLIARSLEAVLTSQGA